MPNIGTTEVVETVADEELENKIKEFIDIAEKSPEAYREKIFEVLLNNYLRRTPPPTAVSERVETPVPVVAPQKFMIPIGVRAVLQQYDVPEEAIQRLFLIEGAEVQRKYKLTTDKKAVAQMQVALLTALENALKPNGKFEFSMDVVKTRCRDDYGAYDVANFKAYFKKNSKLFKSLDDEEHVELSTDGKAELAEAILAVVG
jgi:hypothetical protein